MFVTPAYAQTLGGGSDLVMSILPFVLMFIIFYFLLIRPQRKAAQERTEMLGNVRRNDTIVTGGGIIAKVTKVVDDNEVEVEIAKDVKIRLVRAMIADVRVKGEPAK